MVGIVVNSISEVTTATSGENNESKKVPEGDVSSELNALKEHIEKLEKLIEMQNK